VENTANRYPGQSGGNDTGSLVTEQVRQGTQQIAQGTQQAAGQILDQAQQQAQSVFDRQKGQATSTLGTVTQALRQAGDSLRQQDQSSAAALLENAAGRIEGVSTFIEQRDLPEIIDEVERFARRNSALFLGGAFALGVLAARFLKSSTPPPPSYGTTGYSGAPGGYPNYRGYDTYTAYRPYETAPSYTAPPVDTGLSYPEATRSSGDLYAGQTSTAAFSAGTTDYATDLAADSDTEVTDVPTDRSY
jgi:hypothetical protein